MSHWTASRSTRFVLGAALFVGLAPAMARATTLTSDDFSYPNGNLVGQGGWQAHSGAGAKPIQVTGGSILVQQSAGSGEDVNKRWFTPQSATAKTYASFNLTVPAGATLSADEYFAHFRPAPTDTLNFRARIYVGPPGDASTYSLGISVLSSATSPVVHWPTPLLYGQTYRVVSAYDAAAGTVQLWVNPISEASPSIGSGPVTGSTGQLIESYCFRQSALNTSNQQIDDLQVGTAFADVVPVGLPAAGTWGLIALGTLLVSAGASFGLRRRSPVA